MASNSIILPLDADRIYVERFEYEAEGIWHRPKVASIGLDLGYTFDGDLTEGYFYFYLIAVFRMRSEDGAPVITAGLSLTGEFTPRIEDFPKEATVEEIAEWVGANAISLLYSKAMLVVEQRLNDSPIDHIALPAINPYAVWRNGEIEDGEFWSEVSYGDLLQAFASKDAKPFEYQNEPNTDGDKSEQTDDVHKSENDKAENRGTEGMWTLTDDGEFVLNEPFRTKLEKAKIVSTQGWYDALLEYLVEETPYSWEELHIELLRRNQKAGSKTEIFDEFVLEALGGDL